MAEDIQKEQTVMTPAEKVEVQQTARRVFLDPSSPPVRSIVRVVIITLLLIAVFEFAKNILYSLTTLFFIIILAVFFAYLLAPLVKIIRRPFEIRHLEKFMPRALAIFLAYLIVFTILGASISYLLPKISNQVKEFSTNLPEYSGRIQGTITEINQSLARVRISANVQQQIAEQLRDFILNAGNYLTGFLGSLALSILTYAPWLILVPILGFFFLKDVNVFHIMLLRIFPPGKWRARAESVISDVNKTLAGYVRAQIISCLLIGFVCTIAFYIFGLNYALLFGILAGIFEFIPLLGPLTIAIIAVSAAFLQSPWLALYIAIFLIVLRITHDYVTYPRIVRGGVHLHPLAIILSVLAGEQVAGIPGVFLSIPIIALLTVIYKHVLEHSGSRGFFAGLLEPKKQEKEIIENI